VALNNQNIVYGLFSEQITLTAVVFDAYSTPVNDGFVTFTDLGQTATVPIINGLATATLTIPLAVENPLFNTVMFSYSANSNNFEPSSGMFPIGPTLLQFWMQMMALQIFMNMNSSNS
jgi:hypothetical protein